MPTMKHQRGNCVISNNLILYLDEVLAILAKDKKEKEANNAS